MPRYDPVPFTTLSKWFEVARSLFVEQVARYIPLDIAHGGAVRLPAVLLSLALFVGPGLAKAADTVLVFAAASLTDAVTQVAEQFQRNTGTVVKLAFASSSTLARQIEAGAPAQVFASANEDWMDYLQQRGLIVDSSRISPIGNTLVLVAPSDSELPPITPSANTDLVTPLGPDGRLAVGDPAHVPAGRYARETLMALGLWTMLESRLAFTDNVRAALALVERGEALLGIVYGTDVRVAKVHKLGVFPISSHSTITYPFALVRGGDTAAARDFFQFLTQDEGLDTLQQHGFRLAETMQPGVAPN